GGSRRAGTAISPPPTTFATSCWHKGFTSRTGPAAPPGGGVELVASHARHPLSRCATLSRYREEPKPTRQSSPVAAAPWAWIAALPPAARDDGVLVAMNQPSILRADGAEP